MGSSGFDYRNRIRAFELVVLPLPSWPPFMCPTPATLQALDGEAYGWRLFSFLSYPMRPQATSHFIPSSQSSQDVRLFVWGAAGCESARFRTSRTALNVLFVRARTCPKRIRTPQRPIQNRPEEDSGRFLFILRFRREYRLRLNRFAVPCLR